MRVSTENIGNCVVVDVASAEVDLTVSADFKDSVLDAYDRHGPGNLLLGLGQVRFMDSKAIGAMVSINKVVQRQGGRMAICDLHPHVQKIVDVVTLGTIFDVFGTRQEALEMFCGRS
jgi:anti-sigma B factor antagonist